MERVGDALAHEAVCRECQRNVVRLQRNLHIIEVKRLEDADVLERRLDERLRRDAAVLLEQPLVERACIDADTDRDARLFRRADDRPHLLLAADIAGIQAQGVDALTDCLEREPVVKVDVRDERHVHLAQDIPEVLRRLHVGYGEAHDVTARRAQGADLADGRFRVLRLRVRHRLHGNRRAASDGNAADMDLARVLPRECLGQDASFFL